jgi:outer membrane lipoprotein-sorting protein
MKKMTKVLAALVVAGGLVVGAVAAPADAAILKIQSAHDSGWD